MDDSQSAGVQQGIEEYGLRREQHGDEKGERANSPGPVVQQCDCRNGEGKPYFEGIQGMKDEMADFEGDRQCQ